jgi:hypothetical protein
MKLYVAIGGNRSGQFLGLVGSFTSLDDAVEGVKTFEQHRQTETQGEFVPCRNYEHIDGKDRWGRTTWTIFGETITHYIITEVEANSTV